jgi:hypothetical protein
MYWIGIIVGGLIITFIVSRLLTLVFRRWLANPKALVAANLATLVIATVIGGFGLADGGAPKFVLAFAQYTIPVLIWLVFDFVRWKMATKAS